ncbi:MAG: hypothetical protein ACRDNI_05415 [Gaiellaceae bacterium]
MRKLLVLVVAASAALAAPASATPPSPVTGTFAVVTATTTSTRTAGGNTFVTLTRTAVVSGTFTGTTTDEVLLVTHANGTTSLRGEGTCICTIEGRSGTFDYRFRGSGIFPTSGSGRYVVGHGTGGLSGLHAVGPFSGDFFVANLGGQYHFD